MNLAGFTGHALTQLRRDVARSSDPDLVALLAEVEGHTAVRALARTPRPRPPVPRSRRSRLRGPRGELALFTTITTFGTPVDVTVEELAPALFFPADAVTRRRLLS